MVVRLVLQVAQERSAQWVCRICSMLLCFAVCLPALPIPVLSHSGLHNSVLSRILLGVAFLHFTVLFCLAPCDGTGHCPVMVQGIALCLYTLSRMACAGNLAARQGSHALCTVWSFAVLYCDVLWRTVQYHTVLYSSVLYYCVLWSLRVPDHTVRGSIVLFCPAGAEGLAQRRAAHPPPCGKRGETTMQTPLYCATTSCTILCCTVFRCPAGVGEFFCQAVLYLHASNGRGAPASIRSPSSCTGGSDGFL